MGGRGKVGKGMEVWQQEQQLLLQVHLQLRQVWQQLLQQHLVAAVWELLQLQAEGQQQPAGQLAVGQLAVLQASSAADSAVQPVDQLLELPDQVEEAEVEPVGLPVAAGLASPQAARVTPPSADGRLPERGGAQWIRNLLLKTQLDFSLTCWLVNRI